MAVLKIETRNTHTCSCLHMSVSIGLAVSIGSLCWVDICVYHDAHVMNVKKKKAEKKNIEHYNATLRISLLFFQKHPLQLLALGARLTMRLAQTLTAIQGYSTACAVLPSQCRDQGPAKDSGRPWLAPGVADSSVFACFVAGRRGLVHRRRFDEFLIEAAPRRSSPRSCGCQWAGF